ncbi:MAG: YncE family protein [Candidatus Nitricoxidivorans perseverans]|uniref:YncE family protein n=1 Tax=Candidatus Nitricoxidivorans perseverans TaxID=2975601 RepID=A0AA49FMG1_9PROT|nr:MAG: YncE family protein [Candidatus Nitricoxidivorans perseverans]
MKLSLPRLLTASFASVAAAGSIGVASAATAADVKVTWPSVIVHLHAGNGKAYLVDPATDTVVATLDTTKGAALGATTPNGTKVYVGAEAESSGAVTVIDLKQRNVAARIHTGTRPKHPSVSPDGKWVMVNHWGLDNGKLRVSFIDTARDRVGENVEIAVAGQAKGPTSMHNAWSYDSKLAFTVDRVDDNLVVINVGDWSVKKIKTPSKPHYVSPSPDGKELWVTVEGKDADKERPAALVYDLTKADMPMIARVDMPLKNQGVIEGHHGNFTQDGRYFFILNRGPGSKAEGNEVAVFDAKTKKYVDRTDTGSSGIGHTYNTPDGKYAVVTNYGNNKISIIDAKTFKLVKDLTIGKGRMGHVAFTSDSRWGYVSNAGDGNLHKIDMSTLELVKEIQTGNAAGGTQVLNVWTNIFEELPR